MSSTGPIESDRELLANLKQDESNTYQSGESRATKEHIAGKKQVSRWASTVLTVV